MPVILQSATRKNAAPCQHFSVTLLVDGEPKVFNVDFPLNGSITDDEVRAVLKLWVRYQLLHGKLLSQMVGGVIFQELL